jgi:hypothetical protein
MQNKTRIIAVAAGICSIAVLTGCAALNIGGSADPRWAEYKTWTKVTDGETGDPTNFIGNVHAGPTGYRNVYVNDEGLDTINVSDARSFPVGTVLVKEQFKSKSAWESGKGGAVTVGLKVAGGADDAPSADSWIWADSLKATPKANAFCSGCHTIAQKHDFMFTGGGYHK